MKKRNSWSTPEEYRKIQCYFDTIHKEKSSSGVRKNRNKINTKKKERIYSLESHTREA